MIAFLFNQHTRDGKSRMRKQITCIEQAATMEAEPAEKAMTTLALSIPVAMGYIPLGMVFGFLFVQAGAAWWIAPLFSIMVFAGAAQFMVVPMLAAGMPLGSIAIATCIVNLRHIFYGLSLLERMPRNPFARGYLIWALTDENYSVLSALSADTPAGRMVGVAMLNHGWWVLGSLLGAIIGAQADVPLEGFEFSLAALFAVLAVEQWRASRKALPVMLIAVALYAFSRLIAPTQALLVSIALCTMMVILLPRQTGR